MSLEVFKELAGLSTTIGKQPDFVQRGGGNTSVKFGNGLMAIKASGCRLSEMTADKGFVVINQQAVKEYFDRVDMSSGTDYEKDAVEFVNNNIVDFPGIAKMRPSVEAPFHSFLKCVVIHSHSVYANILCCSSEGESLASRIFEEELFIWIPYVNPGFTLSWVIKKAVDERVEKTGVFPKVIFMQNHGVIVSEDTSSSCIALHEEVNRKIIDFFQLPMPYPAPSIQKVNEGQYKSTGELVTSLFDMSKANYEYLDHYALYPDQLVYLNKSFALKDRKILVEVNKEVLYNASEREASGIEDTLAAYLYVLDIISKLKLNVSVLNDEQKAFIYGWEIEQYRLKQAGG
ncbi:MAG TPA: class II aldolase [Clostridiales bacterium]|nr:class II aldolase [Clostridiales bacterium]